MTEYRDIRGKLFWSAACEDPIKAINFALDEFDTDWESMEFLTAWREGDIAEWPEFVERVGKEAQKDMGK